MTRKISVVFVLTIFLISLVSMTAFAAKAKKMAKGVDPRDVVSLSSLTPAKVEGGEAVPEGEAEITPASFADYIGMGFSPSHTVTVGFTYQDYQKNGSMGRQIVLGGGDPGGPGSGPDSTWQHNVFMRLPTAGLTGREVRYVGIRKTVGTISEETDIEGTAGGGYITVDYDATGTGPGPTDVGAAVVAYHRVAAGGTRMGRDFGLGQASFAMFTMPAAPNCAGIVTQGGTEGVYIWPVIATDVQAGTGVGYTMSSESTPAAGDRQTIVFNKSNLGITAPGATCPRFIDSVMVIAPVVVADPASNKVAIVWSRCRDFGLDETQINNDVVYIESSDNGTTWPAAGTYTNITNYPTSAVGRAYTDLAALYSGGCLHVVWPTGEYDSVAGTILVRGNRLMHWDDCLDCVSLVTQEDAFAANCATGVWNRNIAKPSISECKVGSDTRLFVTYTRFTADDDILPSDDCSAAGYANGEIYAQASSTGGVTWGPPVNLTNTMSNNCALGACFSEHWSSCAPYNQDSLHIQYVEDKDAGGIVQTEGGWTNNPVKLMHHPCFTMSTFATLSANPSEFVYPTHTTPGGTTDVVAVLTNAGNSSTTYTASVTYTSGTGWITFLAGSGSGSVPAGCTNSANLQIRFTGPGTQGLYQATINVTYPNEERAVLAIDVDLYNFTNFFLPQNAALRTSCNRMLVQQTSRSGDQNQGTSGMHYFSDAADIYYMFDGSLVVGNSATNLSWLAFEGGSGLPTTNNPFGPLYALSNTAYDSTSSASYRKASGTGTNRDSSVAFDVQWFAHKHPDSCDFYVLALDVYAGPKNPAGPVNNLTIAYAADFDVPSDTGSDNTSGFDEDLEMVYQQGAYSGPNTTRFASLAGASPSGPIDGGFVWDNPTSVYPEGTYENDSIWNKIQNTVGYESFTDSITDLNSVIILDRGATVTATKKRFYVIVAAQSLAKMGSLAGLKNAVEKARKFVCDHVDNTPPFCSLCSSCGDADGSSSIDVSDAVFLIQYIFAGGPAPGDCNYANGLGDADGSGSVDVSDAVYLIQYIFAGGPAPHCQGM